MTDLALRFADVSKAYGGAAALSGLTLEVRRGEFFGLVGVNGAGKTTLIKCLLDFCDTDGGAIEIFSVSHRATHARARLAFLPERFNPPFYLTGRDFLQYLLSLHRTPYDETRATRMFQALDLEPSALDRPARAYSKGMTQKLGLAACLLSGKELYVLDEPTGGLDPKARALLKGELKGLRNAGHTVFFTSHALADVAEMCDRMAVLHAGRLRFAGTPQELINQFGATSLEKAFLACIEA
ncbi:MAG TPA: ABC transporter ATP-binding protein [Burkholderiales bacterium]|nr:ABC transporter ATP-binding protein [Burkholderiales bacterium]